MTPLLPGRRHHQSTPLLLLIVGLCLRTSFVHAVRPSLGCSSKSSTALGLELTPGETYNFDRTAPGTQTRTHRITIPGNYDSVDENSPSPVLLYFHGWGGNHKSCGDRCHSEAPDRGFVSLSMTGYGPRFFNSWKFAGSVSSPGPEGPTCTPASTNYCNNYKNSGCDCSDADNCWWTTCFDSVEQTLNILDEIEAGLCVDLDQIWAVGCSNGGMFTFELAIDERSKSRIAGIVPIVGLPHYGFSTGPMLDGIRMMGMWGASDTTVPPISNTDEPDRTLETQSNGGGWYYTASNKVMSDWTSGNGCTGTGQDPIVDEDWGIGSYQDKLSCSMGCSERADGVRVVGCIFEAGHVCNGDYIWDPIFNFMLDIPTPNECTENENDEFFVTENNEMPITRDCGWLTSRDDADDICKNRVDANDQFPPAQDVCKTTCESCDPCYENNKTKFLLQIDSGGNPHFKTCGWLSDNTNDAISSICEEATDSYGGYGAPKDACVTTCNVGTC